MPQLLQDIICIIATFQKYAKEEGDCWTLTSGQLKQLLLGEIGNFLKPVDILTVGSNLNLLERDGDGSINFDDFILLVFNLLNICYQDIQSFLNLEPNPESNREEKLSEDMEVCETSENYQEEVGKGQYKQRLPGTESPSLVNSTEKEPNTLNKENPQDDLETIRLPGRKVELDHSKSLYQDEEDEQSQERTQDVQGTGGDGIPPEENTSSKEFVKRAFSQKDERIVTEGYELPRKQGSTDPMDHPSEQEEGQKKEMQSVYTGETAKTTSENQEGTTIKDMRDHIETRELPSQENHERESETPDLPTETIEGKGSETKRLLEPKDDNRTPDIQEPQVQEKEYETQNKASKDDSNKDSEIEVFIDERKEVRKPETSDTVGHTGNEKKNQMETLTEQEPEGKEKQLEGLTEEDIGKDSETPGLKSEDDQNQPELEKTATSEKEGTVSEISKPEFQGDSGSISVAKRSPETKSEVKDLRSQDDQYGRKNGIITQTLDQPTEQNDEHQVENQNDGPLSKTFNNPEDDENGSKSRNIPEKGNSQSQLDAQQQSDEGDGKNNPGKQESLVLLGDKSRTPEKTVLIEKEDNENYTKEQEQLAKATVEDSEGQPGSPESVKQKVTAGSPETETTDLTNDEDGQLFLEEQTEKAHRKDPKTQGPDAKEEEGEELESQEAQLEGQDREAPGLTLDANPDTLNTLSREDKSPQKPSGEGSEQQHVANKEDDSETVEKKSKETETCSNSVNYYWQKTTEQPHLPDPEEQIGQIDATPESDPDNRQEPRFQETESDDLDGNQQEIPTSQSQRDTRDQFQKKRPTTTKVMAVPKKH